MAQQATSSDTQRASRLSQEAQRSLAGLFGETPESRSSADRVRSALQIAIDEGVVLPDTRLAEMTLASIFGVSRTPIREALHRLEVDQLVTRDRGGRVVVSPLDASQIIDIYIVRESLDGTAARLAAKYASLLDIAAMLQINSEMGSALDEHDVDRLARLNGEFHSLLAQSSRSQLIICFVNQLSRRLRRFKSTTLSVAERAQEAIREHDLLISAIREGQAEEAESLARAHMRAAMNVRVLLEARPNDA